MTEDSVSDREQERIERWPKSCSVVASDLFRPRHCIENSRVKGRVDIFYGAGGLAAESITCSQIYCDDVEVNLVAVSRGTAEQAERRETPDKKYDGQRKRKQKDA